MEDYYACLGVSPDANLEEIKKKYKPLALKYHPDKPAGNKQKFIAIQDAYEVLSNEESRKKYNIKRSRIRCKPTSTPRQPARQKPGNNGPSSFPKGKSSGINKPQSGGPIPKSAFSSQPGSSAFGKSTPEMKRRGFDPTAPGGNESASNDSFQASGQSKQPRNHIFFEVESHKNPDGRYQSPTVRAALVGETKGNHLPDLSNSNFPSSPIPPTKPAIVLNNCNQLFLPRQNWDGYAEEVNRYLMEWRNFQRKMFELLVSDHATAHGYWFLEFGKHQQCILQLIEVREWIRTNGAIM